MAERLRAQRLDAVDFPTVPFRRKTVEKAAHRAIGRGEENLDQGRRAGDLNGAEFHLLRLPSSAKNRAES